MISQKDSIHSQKSALDKKIATDTIIHAEALKTSKSNNDLVIQNVNNEKAVLQKEFSDYKVNALKMIEDKEKQYIEISQLYYNEDTLTKFTPIEFTTFISLFFTEGVNYFDPDDAGKYYSEEFLIRDGKYYSKGVHKFTIASMYYNYHTKQLYFDKIDLDGKVRFNNYVNRVNSVLFLGTEAEFGTNRVHEIAYSASPSNHFEVKTMKPRPNNLRI